MSTPAAACQRRSTSSRSVASASLRPSKAWSDHDRRHHPGRDGRSSPAPSRRRDRRSSRRGTVAVRGRPAGGRSTLPSADRPRISLGFSKRCWTFDRPSAMAKFLPTRAQIASLWGRLLQGRPSCRFAVVPPPHAAGMPVSKVSSGRSVTGSRSRGPPPSPRRRRSASPMAPGATPPRPAAWPQGSAPSMPCRRSTTSHPDGPPPWTAAHPRTGDHPVGVTGREIPPRIRGPRTTAEPRCRARPRPAG